MAGAPLWARSATVAAGPFFNFALSALIFSGVIFWGGKPADPLTIAELPPLPSQIQQGLQAGDALITINGSDVTTNEKFAATFRSLPKEPTHNYVVERDGVQLEVLGPYPSVPIVTSLAPKSAAMSVNMKINDVIVAINNFPVFSSDQVMAAVVASEGAPLLLDVWRNGQSIQFTLVPRPRDTPLEGGTFERRWMIGISMGWFFEPKTEPVGVVEAVTDGLRLTGDVITGSLNGLKQVITGAISTCNLNGPVGIAQTSGAMASQGGQSFIWFIAFLSTAVGLLNLFPIPVLDGGHLVFHAYEAITGRQPSARALEIFMAAGVTLLLGLMMFALGHDLFCT
jgi:regulator of sigma E protease